MKLAVTEQDWPPRWSTGASDTGMGGGGGVDNKVVKVEHSPVTVSLVVHINFDVLAHHSEN